MKFWFLAGLVSKGVGDETVGLCIGLCLYHLKILRNHKFYKLSLESQQMGVRSLIQPFQGTLSWSKDDLWAVLLYTNGACESGTERK